MLIARTAVLALAVLAVAPAPARAQAAVVRLAGASDCPVNPNCIPVRDGTLTYAYNFLGIPPEVRISAAAPSTGRHIVGVEFTKERMGEHRESLGPLKLFVDDDVMAEDEIRTMTGHLALCGEGLCIGYDGGDAVSSLYTPQFEWTGGHIVKVSSTWPTTPTSTSSATWPPRGRGT